mmetsp:Transcript_41943/g.84750  ORF Transcript_41943/g.84750 Transcript_41943/m.84750 type:complete len:204 (+) Transcript_41943:256-867(+)
MPTAVTTAALLAVLLGRLLGARATKVKRAAAMRREPEKAHCWLAKQALPLERCQHQKKKKKKTTTTTTTTATLFAEEMNWWWTVSAPLAASSPQAASNTWTARLSETATPGTPRYFERYRPASSPSCRQRPVAISCFGRWPHCGRHRCGHRCPRRRQLQSTGTASAAVVAAADSAAAGFSESCLAQTPSRRSKSLGAAPSRGE